MDSRARLLAAAAALALLAGAPSAAQGAIGAPCGGGVRLLSQPLVVTGLGDLILGTTGPLDDQIQCLLGRRANRSGTASARDSGGCENSDVSGARLAAREATKAVRCMIDLQRTRRGLKPLESHGELTEAAKRHTGRMLSYNCFSHRCSGEPDLVARVTATSYLPCTCAWTVAENLAWGKRRRSTPAAIVDAWMNSPPHRETLLRPDLRDVGVGVKQGDPGNPNSKAATYTADFGVKR